MKYRWTQPGIDDRPMRESERHCRGFVQVTDNQRSQEVTGASPAGRPDCTELTGQPGCLRYKGEAGGGARVLVRVDRGT